MREKRQAKLVHGTDLIGVCDKINEFIKDKEIYEVEILYQDDAKCAFVVYF